MGSRIDQSDEPGLLPPAMEVNRWHQNFVAIMGASPDERQEPTCAQGGCSDAPA